MVDLSRRLEPALGAAVLGITGLLMAAGGLLHPHVPAARVAQMEVLAGNATWLRSHWALTLGQPLAALGVYLLARRLSPAEPAPGLWGGALLAGIGFLVGTLGTLSAATALPAAAETGQESLYATVNAFTLGLGWLCLALTATGGVLFGSRIVSLSGSRTSQAFGWILVAVSAPLIVALAFLSPSHPWTHDVVLRISAVAAGILLAGTGVRLAFGTEEASTRQPTLEGT